jgi:predicted small secreted protein
MTKLKNKTAWARTHVAWLALLVLPMILTACNNGSGGNGY